MSPSDCGQHVIRTEQKRVGETQYGAIVILYCISISAMGVREIEKNMHS